MQHLLLFLDVYLNVKNHKDSPISSENIANQRSAGTGLADSISLHKLETRIFPYMCFVQQAIKTSLESFPTKII